MHVLQHTKKLQVVKGRMLHSFTKGRVRKINDMKESSTFSTSWQSSIFSDQLQLRMDMPCYPPKPAMCCSNRQILPSNCEATFWNYWLAYRYWHTAGMKMEMINSRLVRLSTYCRDEKLK